MKDEEDARISNQIVEAAKKKEAMMAARVAKRKQMKTEMDHFTTIYWEKRNREEKVQKEKDRNFQAFWTSYNKKLVTLILLPPPPSLSLPFPYFLA